MMDKYLVVGCAHGAAAHKIKDCLNDGGDRHRYYFFIG
jgi:hypothetical protein